MRSYNDIEIKNIRIICLILNARSTCDAGDDRFFQREEILVDEYVNSRPEAMGENDLC